MPNHPPILIVVINWRQPRLTVECIHSLQKLDYPYKNFLLIDNGSGDTSLETFQNAIPHITVLALPDNLGFARGANIGLRYAMQNNFEYALLINNDAFPETDMLTRLYREIQPDIALLSPKIYYEAEPDRIWFAGGQRHPSLLEIRNRGQGEIDNPKWQTSQDVDYLLGTCLLINLPLASQENFFDERYFMYYEDLDLSLRCQSAGFRLRFVSDAHLYHRVAVSSGGENSPSRIYFIARSSLIFFLTHHKRGNSLAIFIFRMLSTIKKISFWLWRGNIRAVRSHLRGLRDGWKIGKSTV